MLAVPRALARLSTLSFAALALAPAAPALAAPAVGSPDGLAAHPAHARGPITARAAQVTSADPRAADQWSLQGDEPMGIASAWRQTLGDNNVTVAIVDSGVDLGHPDLAPNLWTNPGEVPGNGVDDDSNGYVDDVHGYDVIDGDGDPQDANGHGTHVAGIVGARGGNGIGGSGVAWRVRLMALRVLDADARGTTTGVATALHYAVDNGARIVNLSLAGPEDAEDLHEAVRYAQDHGVLIVAAAGNESADLAAAPTYPAAYPDANVLGVAATTQAGGLVPVSDHGPGADLAAPGEQVLSTALGGRYEWRTGTSMAAPQVAGALVLLAAARPDLDAAGLRAALLDHTRHSGLDVETGALDVGAALHAIVAPDSWKAAPAPKPAVSARRTRATHQRSTQTRTREAKARKLAARRRARAARARKARAHRAARPVRATRR